MSNVSKVKPADDSLTTGKNEWSLLHPMESEWGSIFLLSMTFAENRVPLFGVMLKSIGRLNGIILPEVILDKVEGFGAGRIWIRPSPKPDGFGSN